jgi:hypothetical protein
LVEFKASVALDVNSTNTLSVKLLRPPVIPSYILSNTSDVAELSDSESPEVNSFKTFSV